MSVLTLRKLLRISLICMVTSGIVALVQTPAVFAQSEEVIYSPQGTNDQYAAPSVWATDEAGNLYGVTYFFPDHGTVFELSPSGSGWTQTTLYSFQGSPDGQEPTGLVCDSAGNLFGTTYFGGAHTGAGCIANSCGTVFELSPNSSGGWTETMLYNFTGGTDGANPWGGLILDKSGNLYGVATQGGSKQWGTVFKLRPSNSGWTFARIYSFGDSGQHDGAFPQENVAMDSAGNLYGTTPSGGLFEQGIAYKLTPSASGDWKETILHEFGSIKDDGNAPFGGVTLDAKGNVYGVASAGGGQCSVTTLGCGTVFELKHGPNGWKETTLYRFGGYPDASAPETTMVFDGHGNLYGAAFGGSGTANDCQFSSGCGTVFKLGHTTSGWTETIVHSFTGVPDGYQVDSSPIFGPGGLLYGGTDFGGTGQCSGGFGVSGCGAIYELQP